LIPCPKNSAFYGGTETKNFGADVPILPPPPTVHQVSANDMMDGTNLQWWEANTVISADDGNYYCRKTDVAIKKLAECMAQYIVIVLKVLLNQISQFSW